MMDELPILHFIYLTIKNIQKRNKTKHVSRTELFEYISPFLIYENINTKSFNSYLKFIFTIDHFVEENYLIYENNNYYINYESDEYKKFVELFNNYKKNIVQLSHTILELNDNIHNIGSQDDQTSDVQDDQTSDVQDDQSSNAQDNKYAEDGLGYYIFKSFCSSQLYLINKKLNKCTCMSYTFCTNNPKTCKHLEFIKNNNNINELDVFEKSCECYNNNIEYICKHITNDFNEN